MPKAKQSCTKIILSGTESERFIDTAYNFAKCRDTLVSFLYAEGKGTKWFEDRLRKYPGISIMVDSGAHTFRSAGTYTEKFPDLQWFEDYAVRMKDWVLKNRDHIDLVVNLDVDKPCGFSNMVKWDNEIFRPLEREGIPVCYVWHEEYGFDAWLKMCREHEYVGLPGHLPEADWNKYMRVAIANGCRVHGFAATKSYILGKVPLASADSISWKSGEMYGQTFVFEGGKLRVFDKHQKDQRLRYKARWVAEGVDWTGLENDEASEITKVCAIAWRDYQEWVTTMTTKLAYWNKTSATVDKLIEGAGGIGNLTKDQIAAFFSEHKFPLAVTSESQAKSDLQDIRAFLARDNLTVFAMSDEAIEEWLKKTGATPENTTRVEKEAAIRQCLYTFFYKIQAAEASPRTTIESVTPEKQPQDRDEPMREYPSVEVDLPDAPGGLLADEPAILALPAPETTLAQPALPAPTTPETPSSSPAKVEDSVVAEPPKFSPDMGFLSGVKDNLLRIRLGYGVELIFEQNKLRAEVGVLKAMKREQRRQRELNQKIAAITTEISTISDAAGPGLAKQMRESAEAAYATWQAARNPAEETKKKLDEKARTLTPQAKLFIANPEVASAVGKLGGAPKGNQNARKHGLYSSKLPQLACDNCPHIQVCPQYRQGHVCAFLTEFANWDSQKPNKELAFLEDLAQSQTTRLRRAMMFETFEGGAINKEVSKLARDAATIVKTLADLKQAARAPGPSAPVVQQDGTPKPSLFATLFGAAKDASFEKAKSQQPPPENPAKI
jgi:hypothetical protein